MSSVKPIRLTIGMPTHRHIAAPDMPRIAKGAVPATHCKLKLQLLCVPNLPPVRPSKPARPAALT
jgi:hypothetical protein